MSININSVLSTNQISDVVAENDNNLITSGAVYNSLANLKIPVLPENPEQPEIGQIWIVE